LILCNDLDQGIRRLRCQIEAWSAIKALTIEAPLSRDDHRSAARRAFEATPREPNSLLLYSYCSYLLELCNGLELAGLRCAGQSKPVTASMVPWSGPFPSQQR
jgi:hypothetical protein